MSRIFIAHEITPAQPQTKTQTPIYDADTEQAKKAAPAKTGRYTAPIMVAS